MTDEKNNSKKIPFYKKILTHIPITIMTGIVVAVTGFFTSQLISSLKKVESLETNNKVIEEKLEEIKNSINQISIENGDRQAEIKSIDEKLSYLTGKVEAMK